MPKYYFPDAEYVDRVFGDQFPTCLDIAEVKRLAKAWETESLTQADIIAQFHEASNQEIAKYGH